MQKMRTLITSKGTDIDENIANQNHAILVPVHRNRGILTSLMCFSGKCTLPKRELRSIQLQTEIDRV
jgi:hypothetical protein